MPKTLSQPPARWIEAPKMEGEAELLQAGISPRVAALLVHRGVETAQEAQAFLNPNLDQLYDPFRLFGMQQAVEQIEAVAKAKEKIAIVGDYDVDGVSATALLAAVLRACGLEVETILPHRLREGYGFQPAHVERALEANCKLLITVDCGTTAYEAAAAAAAGGLPVIVTDHHLPAAAPVPPTAALKDQDTSSTTDAGSPSAAAVSDGEGTIEGEIPQSLPPQTVLINPRQPACSYPFEHLAGAGLALKLAMAVLQHFGKSIDPHRLLSVAALGTIADIVPLVGENRVVAALGLRALAKTRSLGLLALIEKSGIKPPFEASDIGFRIGPRLNAAGRLDSADDALELLLTRDRKRAVELAEFLDLQNRERQSEERQVVAEAREAVLDRVVDGQLPAVLIAWSETWHKGVVGIAAGRLAREFGRPTLLLAVQDNGEATGSGRSVPGVELHSFFARWQNDLLRFGGHAQALGMSVDQDKLEGLRETWEKAAREAWSEDNLRRRHEYELSLEPEAVDLGLMAELKSLEPYGEGNRQPLLRVGPLRLAGSARTFGNGHLSARAQSPDGASVSLIGWSWAQRADDLRGHFEVLAALEEDSYRGGVRLRLIDARPVT